MPFSRNNSLAFILLPSVLQVLQLAVLSAGFFNARHLSAAPVVVPVPLPGWRMELVAEAPRIKHPSVVCSAPDGRVFVAEDPMDISAPAHSALGRIVCFHPDGRMTVFAEKLHAVFGLQYLDGKVYVLQNPRFSVFTDDHGVGKDRVDLIEQTNPNPWALDWNDHVPANFRLGMDGFFYVAVGDKGIYGATGHDGKRVDLQGGGILRLRPDGTELEVYCTGNRNILDVAMNDEDEFFTYDNTDEQQWMGRVTHMVEGGFYGYPHDFIPRRPYTLWMLADYGAGAATGTLCYHEDALPAEYRGNLFLADFGKRQVMRVRVERDGGTYRAIEKTDLFPVPPPDFRPVGIAWSADAMSMFICDWAHRDVKEDVAIGRLWKLTFASNSLAAPKPRWFLPAAQGEAFQAANLELIAALSHPSHAVRQTAQRRLVDRSRRSRREEVPINLRPDQSLLTSAPAKELAALLGNAAAPAIARWHALWALDAIDGGRASQKEVLKAINDPEASVRRQAIRQLGTRRIADATKPLIHRLKDPEASVRFQAATALGRIADPKAVDPLLAALDENDFFTRFAVFTALNRIGRSDAAQWSAIVKGLSRREPTVHEGVEFALRETFDPALVAELARLARNRQQSVAARESALRLLTALHHQAKPWRGEWWAYHPVNQPPPAKTEAWAGTATVLAVLGKHLSDKDARLRLAAVNGVRESGHGPAAPAVRQLFSRETNLEVRQAALRALAALRDTNSVPLIDPVLRNSQPNNPLLPDAIAAAARIGGDRIAQSLIQLLRNQASDTNLALPAIQALGQLKSSEAAGLIAEQLPRREPDVRNAAIESLTQIGGDAALKPTLALLEHDSTEARRGAVGALGRLKNKSAVPALLEARQNPALRMEATTALAQMPDAHALDAYLDGLGGKNAALRESCRRAVTAIQAQALPMIEQRIDTLSPEVIAELRLALAKSSEAKKGKLFAVAAKTLEPADYEQFALKTAGDAARGRELFHNESGVACIKCHIVGERGGRVGPDLSGAGTQFGRAALIESILQPSKVVREGYNQVQIETKDDDFIAGLFKGETGDDITLLDANNQLRRLPKTRIVSRQNSQLSIMPEGLQAALTLQEFADLIAYLESLKSQPGTR
jgi:putative membrane-bound dehydrogenase-like protein